MNSPLLAEYMSEKWAMEPRALEAFLQTMASLPTEYTAQVPWRHFAGVDHEGGIFNTKTASKVFAWTADGSGVPILGDVTPDVNAARLEGGPFDEAPRRSRLTVAEGVGSIAISGVLLKRVPNIARWFGANVTGYAEIRSDLAQAMGDPNVKSIRLKIESPGGMVSGVKETADLIHRARQEKDVTAEIQDVGASAAYWLASQADTITANPNASVGSLGAYTAYADFSEMAAKEGIKIHVVASGPHKGMGVPGSAITEAQLEPVRNLINGIASGFQADIERGRGFHAGHASAWMTGEVWRAEDAVKFKLIDAIKSNTETSSPGGPAAADTPQREVETMANETEKAAAEEKIRSEAATAERKRLGDLKAAFPGEEKFVMEQYEAGASVEKAEAAFSKVLRGRIEAKDAEIATLKAKPEAVKPAGAKTGVESTGEPQGGAPKVSIIAQAKAYAKENECSFEEAMSALSRGEDGERNSAAFEQHLASCDAAAPAHQALKAKAGVS